MFTIGTNIKKLREERGWSMAQLARMIGKSRTAIYQYERNETIPRMGVIEDLARVFGVNKRAILERVDYINAVSENEQDTELLALFRSLPTKAQKALLAAMRTYLDQ